MEGDCGQVKLYAPCRYSYFDYNQISHPAAVAMLSIYSLGSLYNCIVLLQVTGIWNPNDNEWHRDFTCHTTYWLRVFFTINPLNKQIII